MGGVHRAIGINIKTPLDNNKRISKDPMISRSNCPFESSPLLLNRLFHRRSRTLARFFFSFFSLFPFTIFVPPLNIFLRENVSGFN